MTTSAARFTNSEPRSVASVATTACASCSYSARPLGSRRMIGRSRSVAGSIRNIGLSLPLGRPLWNRRAPPLHLDVFERDGAGVPDLVDLVGVEPGPSAGLPEFPRHRADRQALPLR